MESAVNQEMDPAVKQQLIKHSKGWRGINNPWMADGDEHEEFQYINLVVNPERYTGYKVSSIEVTMECAEVWILAALPPCICSDGIMHPEGNSRHPNMNMQEA